MNTDMNGREAKQLWFNGANGDERVVPPTNGKLVMSATYHGDRDEFWIAAVAEDGKELGRHNCRYIGTIEWA